MSRSLRSRKGCNTYPEEEYVLGKKSTKTQTKKLNTPSEEKETENLTNEREANNDIVKGTKKLETKGNLNTGWRTVKAIQTNVLRDRTNIPGELLKVDILMKQGAVQGIAKKPAIKARRGAKSTVTDENDDENVEITSSAIGTRKNIGKIVAVKESVSDQDSRDIDDNVKPENFKNLKIPEKSAKPMRGITRSASLQKNDDKNAKATSSAKITRKTFRKVETVGDTISDVEADNEIPEKSAKTTRGTTRSAKTSVKNVKATSSDKITRKTSEKVETDGDTISDEEAEDTVENVKTVNSRNNEALKKPGKSTRVTTRFAKSAKNDDKNMKPTSIAKITRKTSRKVENYGESISDENAENVKPLNDENNEVSEKPVKSSRGTTRSTTSGKKDNKNMKKITSSPEITRKMSGKAVTAKNSSTKLAEDPKFDAENDENVSGEIGHIYKLVKRSTLKKSVVRASSVKKPEKDAKLTADAIVVRKFFKRRATSDDDKRKMSPLKKTVNAKPKNIGTRKNPRASVSFRLRQTTINESFAKQASPKVLRPRKMVKNYCEQSMIVKKRGSKSTNDEDQEAKKTVPVYKRVVSQDNLTNDKNKIYEFQFDSNDSREKISKNSRRAIARKYVTRKKTKTTESKGKKLQKQTKKLTTTSPRVNVMPNESVEIEKVPMIENVSSGLPMIKEENTKNIVAQVSKPIVVANVALKESERMIVGSTPTIVKTSETKTRNLLRPSKQLRTMLNHALLTKSMSPINKAMENFDPGSPWRPPTFNDQHFSRVKNIVQSTPQVKKMSSKLANTGNTAKIGIDRNNEKLSKILDKKSPIKAFAIAKSPRKFGTEISNNNNNAATIDTRIIEANKENSSDNKISTIVSTAIAKNPEIPSIDTISYDHGEAMNFSNDVFVDKENCLPTRSSPKKSPLKALNKSPLKNSTKSPLKRLNLSPRKRLNETPLKCLHESPLKSLTKQNLTSPKKLFFTANSQIPLMQASNNENLESQAGPSSAKNDDVIDESRILRQSNLDNFLNLDEMPKCTRIKTLHGIFDDAHSTPISGRPVKKIFKVSNVDNAFGFDDNDDTDISPIKGPSTNKPGSTKNQENLRAKKDLAIPARLSIGDIKKHLLPIREKVKVREEPIIESIEEEEKENRESEENEKVTENQEKKSHPITLRDAFDQLAENAETNDPSMKEIPLFADIEPAHFKQAPRYSYKRKRAAGFFFSDEEDENDGPVVAEHQGTKKRKISKVEKEREKQLDNWAKDINQTFEEIDHFDLVVE